jgi:molybdopterin/thiamine biosynthesis adenylyltransferase
MSGKLLHEEIYRGSAGLAKLSALQVVLCGAGAVGSNLADNLTRQGFSKLRAIDHDRIEEHNVSTQLYGVSEVGVWKVEALRNRIFRGAGVEIETERKELTERNAGALLKDADVILDTFDNSAARQLVQIEARRVGKPCLHIGVSGDYAEVIWDERYKVPRDVGEDACNYPLARNLVLLAVAIASETLVGFAIDGVRLDRSVTLRDLRICPFEGT